MIEKLKNAGWTVLGIGLFLGLILLGALMLNGAVWVGEHVLQWLIDLTWIAFAVNLFIFLPLGLFRKTGMFGGIAMYLSSYLFGLTLWFLGLLLTYFHWGFVGVIIGLVLGGVGVVPVAMLAVLVNGELMALFSLIALAVLTIGSKILGMYLAGRAEEKTNQLEYQKLIAHEQE